MCDLHIFLFVLCKFYGNLFETWDTYKDARALPWLLFKKLTNGRISLPLESSSEFCPEFYSFEFIATWFLFLVSLYYCYLGANLCLPRFWHFYPTINNPRWSALLFSKQTKWTGNMSFLCKLAFRFNETLPFRMLFILCLLFLFIIE